MCPHDVSKDDALTASPVEEPGETAETNNSQIRIAYPSDISERQWQRIKPRVSANHQRGRIRSTDIREVINGINYRWNTGYVWRMLPHDFSPWRTIYSYFHRWQQTGVLGDLRDVLLKRDRQARLIFHRRKLIENPEPRWQSRLLTCHAQTREEAEQL